MMSITSLKFSLLIPLNKIPKEFGMIKFSSKHSIYGWKWYNATRTDIIKMLDL